MDSTYKFSASIQPVAFEYIALSDNFWAPRIVINRDVTIPAAFGHCERSGRIENFRRAAAKIRGDGDGNVSHSEFPFDDTDVYKFIEAASHAIASQPDATMEMYLDRLIAYIAAAQEPDGYLYTARTIAPQFPHPWSGPDRWVLERELSHELYNLGHLLEAAAAHYFATKTNSLLDIAIRSADLLGRTFGPGKRSIWPGHQVVELGLMKLYHITKKRHYLDLACFFLEERGPDGEMGSGRSYNQSHLPVIKQREAVGHAVRAVYMYTAMVESVSLTSDPVYVEALDAIWQNMVSAKLYITGGIGARHEGEAFGENYELPNASAYCETCASIANVIWNHRLFLLHGDAKYIDVLERTLYNGLLSGVSLDGRTFFYPNPLQSDGSHVRQPWFDCACCPSNITRFMPTVSGYFYASRDAEVYVNLYAQGTAQVHLQRGGQVTIYQRTRYPWDGRIRLEVSGDACSRVVICLRIPGWSLEHPVPSDLYRFAESSLEAPYVSVNGIQLPLHIEAGYVKLRRAWSAGDVIELHLPMPPRRVLAHDKVNADAGCVALQRGPLVYAVESIDHASIDVRQLILPDHTPLECSERHDVLNDMVVVSAQASMAGGQAVRMTAIPYFAWANRGKSEMAVWLRRG